MKFTVLRVTYAIVAVGLAVCCLAAIRPEVFGISRQEEPAPAMAVSASDPITQFRQEREQLRSLQLSQLDEMIHSPDTSEDMAHMAEEEKLAILRRYEVEETISGILRAQGFAGAAACAEGECVSVLIYGSEPNQAQVAAITELVVSQAGVSAGNIKIIPIN